MANKERGEQVPAWQVWRWSSQRWAKIIVFGSLALAIAAGAM